jgi:CheY-like chemotaxis protein/DNA-binding CsgD family transcriptional regulator
MNTDSFDRPGGEVVLIVDDVPDNLSVLHDALDESGYSVLVALNGESALQRAQQAVPDVILLDAMMPGMDGFEVARRLKANPATAHIPIVFMTGLTETEHLEAALAAGAVDYVTKPIKPREVLARMAVHTRAAKAARQSAQQVHQTRNALDAFGYASITVRVRDGRLLWQTPLARELLHHWFGPHSQQVPEPVHAWLLAQARTAQPDAGPTSQTSQPSQQGQAKPFGGANAPAYPRFHLDQGARRLSFDLHQQVGDSEGGGDWLIVMREASDVAVIHTMGLAFKLTAREAEVLYWVVKGKINRDIADILGASPATVKKHLERVFAKLGVETRTSAAAMAINRIRQSHPSFEA